MQYFFQQSSVRILRAFDTAGHVRAAAVGFAAGDGDIGPSPVLARTAAATDNHDVVAGAAYGARTIDVLDCEVGDGNTRSSSALEVATVVVLLDEYTISTQLL